MSKASIDTKATLSHIRENLNALDSYIIKVSSNIIKFNQYVTEQLINLHARGGVTHDLLINLWKAYLNVSDRSFIGYIQRKRDAYDEGEDINPERLMVLAENKYKSLLQEDQWNTKTKEQSQIVSLQAEINKLKDNRVQFGSRKGKSKSNENKDRVKKDHNSYSKSNPGKKKSARDKFQQKWAWKKNAPNPGESNTKVHNDKTYYWCNGHKLWCATRHDRSNCEFLKTGTQIQANEAIPESQPPSNSAVSFASHYTSILAEE